MTLHPRLISLIDLRLKGAIKNFIVIPDGSEFWVVDTDNKEWVISITSDGTLKYNFIFFNYLFAVFSLTWVEYQKVLKNWCEQIFKIPIRQIQRVGGNMGYVVEKLQKKTRKWDLRKRYEFSYKVVKEYLDKKNKSDEVKLENYFQ